MSTDTDTPTETETKTETDGDSDSDSDEYRCSSCGKPFDTKQGRDSHQRQSADCGDREADPDSPEAIWADVDPVAEGQASDEFEDKTLSNGKPVRAKDLSQADLERYRERVEARNRDIDDDEIAERAIMLGLKESYEVPSFEKLTYEKYKRGKLGYYNKFLEAIAPEIAANRRSGNR